MGKLTASLGIVSILGAAPAAVPPGEQFTRPFGMALIDTTVADVQHRFGSAPVSRSGHYEETVCYFDAGSRTLVEFMHQGEGLSGRFTARRVRARAPRGCARLPVSAVSELNRGVGGLRLGMARREFVATVGGKVRTGDGFVTATFERSEPLPPKTDPRRPADPLFTSIVVQGLFEAESLVEYVIFKTSST